MNRRGRSAAARAVLSPYIFRPRRHREELVWKIGIFTAEGGGKRENYRMTTVWHCVAHGCDDALVSYAVSNKRPLRADRVWAEISKAREGFSNALTALAIALPLAHVTAKMVVRFWRVVVAKGRAQV